MNFGLMLKVQRILHRRIHSLWIILPGPIKSFIRSQKAFSVISSWLLQYSKFQSSYSERKSNLRQRVESVDVVITSYKQARYLSDSLLSVLCQTMQPRRIIVVVHDEDKDEIAMIQSLIDSIETKIEICFTTHPECWPGKARNHGASFSTSDAIVFLDADDKIYSSYLFNAVLYMNYFEQDYVGCWSVTFGEGVTPEVWKVPSRPNIQNYESSNSSPVSSLIRRSSFDLVDGWRDSDNKGIKVDEALDLWRRIVLSNLYGINIQSPMIQMRRHLANRSKQNSEKQFFDSRFLKKQMKSYLKEFRSEISPVRSEISIMSSELRHTLGSITQKHDGKETVLILLADAKPFGAGKVSANLVEIFLENDKNVLLINLDINGLGFGFEMLSPNLSRIPIIELGNVISPELWLQFLRQVLVSLKIKEIYSMAHPYANELLVKLKSEFRDIDNKVFLFNTQSLHANWIANNPNSLDKILVENSHSFIWLLDHGWNPKRIYKVAHTAHRVGIHQDVSSHEQELPDGVLKILWFHRFATEKQPKVFLNLASESLSQSLDVQYIFGGEGPLRGEIARQSSPLENLSFLPENLQNIEALKLGDILISTSSNIEGRPLVCTEALEMGLLLLLPDLPSLIDFKTDGFDGVFFYQNINEVPSILMNLDVLSLRRNRLARADFNRNIATLRAESGPGSLRNFCVE
jgi:glycosyltransferase involved in cell wall biosynthesis